MAWPNTGVACLVMTEMRRYGDYFFNCTLTTLLLSLSHLTTLLFVSSLPTTQASPAQSSPAPPRRGALPLPMLSWPSRAGLAFRHPNLTPLKRRDSV
ncbi:hypothetical protein E2C01_058352 [Portunus trituberculatus]|uniref:Uncharacterized protein n=1 Tax=Portunus trituberculatus TaxID=210409 RepID=A0A5B7GVD1_PORTR|nr:hypothetical protein [Portunus trituberculatus]